MNIKKLKDNAIVPTYATAGSAAFDLYSTQDIIIEPGNRELVSTGLSFEIPEGYEIQIRPRSGIAYKWGITVLNSPGTIDSDYTGELKVILINHSESDYSFRVCEGDRIAQGVLAKVEPHQQFTVVDEIKNTDRGQGGFGSSGS